MASPSPSPADQPPATFLDYRAMADTAASASTSPARTSRSQSPAAANGSTKAPRRLLSPLRAGPRSPGLQEEMHAPANGAPKIMRSAPTGSPLSAQEPSEFPFHMPMPVPVPASGSAPAPAPAPAPASASSTANGAPIQHVEAIDYAAPRVPQPSSHASNASTSSYYPPFAPVSRIPTAEGEPVDANAPKERKSVQFARSATYGSDIAATSSRQQSWEADDAKARPKNRDDSTLMGKLRALAAPMQSHGRSHSANVVGTISPHSQSPYGPLSPANERDEFRFDGNHDSEADADAESSAGEGASRPTQKRKRSRR
ncbi:Phospholipase D1, partial [Ascochyta clinopodiicola]